MSSILGLVLVLIAAGLLLGLTFIQRKSPPIFREIAAYITPEACHRHLG